MIIEAPKYFTIKHVENFIGDVSRYFESKEKKETGFVLNVSKIKEICLLGQLILYKFISFTAENNCFEKPIIHGIDNPILKEQLGRSGFWELINTYVKRPNDKKAIEKSYNNLKVVNENDLLIAPQQLLRENGANEKKELEKMYLTKILDFYHNTQSAHTICFCIAELLSNFWSHATRDTGTVMVAKGNKSFIDICFADTGGGIINSFRKSSPIYNRMTDRAIMVKALEKNVTSKPNSNHLGMGLYMINCIVSSGKNNMLKIFSDSQSYVCSGKVKGEHKRVSCWRGTITYLRLNIENLLSLDKIEELKTSSYMKIKWS